MPYSTNADLPDGVKNALPVEAQSIFRAAVNSALKTYDDDETKAFAVAWAAVKRAGWHKSGDKWAKRDYSITKIDEEKQRVFGWASISIKKDGQLLVDTQDDLIEPQDLEEAIYDFNLESRDMGVMHEGVAKGRLIESLVVTSEKLAAMGLPDDSLPMGAWVGFQIDDADTWEKVKNGNFRMFSIQGKAVREDVNEAA